MDLFGSQIQGDLIRASQWRIYHGVAKVRWRARVRARAEEGGCALLLGDGRETSGLKVYWRGPRAQWLRTPRPALPVRQVWWKPAVV